jgi:hypothetical protein
MKNVGRPQGDGGDSMEQAELQRVRAENAQIRQQLADAAAALDKVAASVRELPKLELVIRASETLPGPRNASGWVAAALPSKTPRTKSVQCKVT